MNTTPVTSGAAPQPAPATQPGPAEPWFVVQNGQKVSRPLSEAEAREEARRRNGATQESGGQPSYAPKQAIYG